MAVIAENRANKRSTWQATPTNVAYPSEKLVKDTLDTKVKLTKMPDGATAVYSQDAWATADGWGGETVSVSDGTLIITSAGTSLQASKTVAGATAKMFIARIKSSKVGAVINLRYFSGTGAVTIASQTINNANEYAILKGVVGATYGNLVYIQATGVVASDTITVDWIWIGDYSYLDNSLATEASRIANQLGDTAGVGSKAIGAITNNLAGPLVDGETITLGGLVYTFKDTLTGAYGEVKIQTATNDTLLFLATLITNGGDGASGKALQNPLLTATYQTGGIVNLYARNSGILGNSITLVTTASTLTPSGSTLTGGTDDVGEKMRTQIASLNGQWITPTLTNSWVAFDTRTSKYMKAANGDIRLKGVVKSGTVGTTMFTLPSGYRPAETQSFPCVSNGAFGYITITSAGAVTCTSGNNTSVFLDGITFKSEA